MVLFNFGIIPTITYINHIHSVSQEKFYYDFLFIQGHVSKASYGFAKVSLFQFYITINNSSPEIQ